MVIMTNDKIDNHLAEVVWVPTTGEEPVSDEATAGTEDKILLEKWQNRTAPLLLL